MKAVSSLDIKYSSASTESKKTEKTNAQTLPITKKTQAVASQAMTSPNTPNSPPLNCGQRICKFLASIADAFRWLINKISACFRNIFCSESEGVAKGEETPRHVVLQRLMKETMGAAKNGFYIGKKLCHLDPQKTKSMQEGTEMVESPEKLTAPGPHGATKVKVYNLDTFLTARTLQKKGLKPTALNMANAEEPGGGAFRGAWAQEERLFHRSNYFQSLCPDENPHLKEQLEDGNYLIPELGLVYSPDVQVFRNGDDQQYSFAKPYCVDMIGCAAYCKGHDMPKKDAVYVANTKEKIRAMLRHSVNTGHDSIVLGAFGCGAFRNDPKRMVTFFKDVLQENEFKGHFREIAFGVIDDGRGPNHQIFKEALDGLEI